MSAVCRNRFRLLIAGLVALTGSLAVFQVAQACPFCAAVSLTFSEEINNSQVAVIAKLVQLPPRAQGNAAQNASLEVAKAKFEIITVLKGEEILGKNRAIETVYFGESPVGSTFLIMGIDPPTINWGTPIAISERGRTYVAKAIELPKEGADRMVFFQDYLEDGDEMLARDAYDEFAKVPYSSVHDMKDRMKHDKLIEWIKSPQIPVSRRRLYLTMLGVCGTDKDLPLLEEMISSKDRQTKGALDALVAAYLTLKGPDGMKLVEDMFLKNKDAEYTDTYATIMALRFHGTEEKIIPRERLLVGIRAMLERPQLADLVIPDLARWEDWSVMDRLVELFKNADDESSWVRVPVINYLRACPLPQAKARIEELAKLDPDTVKRANTFFPLPGAAPPVAADNPAANNPADVAKDGAKEVEKDDAAPAAAAPNSEKSPPAAQSGPPAATGAAEKANSEQASTDNKQPATATANTASSTTGDQTIAAAPKSLSKNPEAPAGASTTVPVFGGLAAAAALLGCAFWAILKGGQHAAG
jgi:hypothetical protein